MASALIVSNTGDIHTDLLVDACARLGVPCFRWNTDRFRFSGHLIWDVGAGTGVIEIDDRSSALNAFTLVVYRRPESAYRARLDIADRWVGAVLDDEWRAVEGALSYASKAKIVNTLGGSARAKNKIIQIQVASAAGLKVPETIISTDIKALQEFAGHFPCVTKGVESSFNLTNGVLRSGMTSRVSLSDLETYLSTGCPTLLQRDIFPKAIWRIIVVGDAVFGFRLNGDMLADQVDSRKVEPLLNCSAAEVPKVTKNALLRMCKELQVLYVSSDFAEDCNGDLWFLDLNPEGQWGYYEEKCGVSVSDAIARLALQ